MKRAIDSPMADHKEYLPPTHCTNTTMHDVKFRVYHKVEFFLNLSPKNTFVSVKGL